MDRDLTEPTICRDFSQSPDRTIVLPPPQYTLVQDPEICPVRISCLLDLPNPHPSTPPVESLAYHYIRPALERKHDARQTIPGNPTSIWMPPMPEQTRFVQKPVRHRLPSTLDYDRGYSREVGHKDWHDQQKRNRISLSGEYPPASTPVHVKRQVSAPEPLMLASNSGSSFEGSQHRRKNLATADPLSSQSRPALRLSVHGFSLVDENVQTTFAPRPSLAGKMGDTRLQSRTGPSTTRDYKVISRQPTRQLSMTLVGDRNAKGISISLDGTRDWSSDLCHFDRDLRICCEAFWCPCIVYGRNKARVEHLYAKEKVLPFREGGSCNHDCAVHGCLTAICCFGWALQVPSRASVRRRYDIEGDWLGDCGAALCCSSCQLSQDSREIALEERSLPDFAEKDKYTYSPVRKWMHKSN
ncbi:PLAC8 family-domain-containing protein [Crassisporium funariophilum]|nr:PLAC8 family-domain-containing protein [Crassisporium funariophilum]